MFAGGNETIETFRTVEDASVKSERFSPPWFEQYSGGTPGCKLGRGRYNWRPHGLLSNINSEYFGEMLVTTPKYSTCNNVEYSSVATLRLA